MERHGLYRLSHDGVRAQGHPSPATAHEDKILLGSDNDDNDGGQRGADCNTVRYSSASGENHELTEKSAHLFFSATLFASDFSPPFHGSAFKSARPYQSENGLCLKLSFSLSDYCMK